MTTQMDRWTTRSPKHTQHQKLKVTNEPDQPFYGIPLLINDRINLESLAVQHFATWVSDHIGVEIDSDKPGIIRVGSWQNMQPEGNLVHFADL